MSDAGFSATRLERTRTAMQQFVETGDVAGCVILVWRHGEIARVDMLGHSDSETRTPMTRSLEVTIIEDWRRLPPHERLDYRRRRPGPASSAAGGRKRALPATDG